MVERLARRPFGERGEGALGALHVGAARRLPQFLAVAEVGRKGGFLDELEDFVFASALLLDAGCGAIENLEDGQSLLILWKFARHLVGGCQGHERVVACVVLSAESSRVRESAGGDQRAKVRPCAELGYEQRQETIRRRLLH